MDDASVLLPNPPLATEAAEQLVEAVRLLANAHSLAEVISIAKTAARRITQADGASFVLRDGNLCYYADEDAIEPLWKGRRFPMESCVSGWAMRQRQPAIIPDVFQDARVPHDAYRPTFVKSLAMVPIRTLQPIGAIGIYWKQVASPTVEAVRWLQSLADSTALALEHLQDLKEIKDSQLEARLLQQANAALRRELEPSDRGGCVKMCFITKRFEVAGQWLSVEAFLQQRYGLQITHGLSPEGLARLEGDETSDNALMGTSGSVQER